MKTTNGMKAMKVMKTKSAMKTNTMATTKAMKAMEAMTAMKAMKVMKAMSARKGSVQIKLNAEYTDWKTRRGVVACLLTHEHALNFLAQRLHKAGLLN